LELIDLSNDVVAGNLVYVMCSYCEDITLAALVMHVKHVDTFCFGTTKPKQTKK